MKDPDLAVWTRALGREFVRRGMWSHAAKLRIYYLALKQELLPVSGELNVSWSRDFVIDWMETLQLPPFDKRLASLPRGSRCPTCHLEPDRASPSAMVERNFPGGFRLICTKCSTRWLELEPAAAPVSQDGSAVGGGRSPPPRPSHPDE